MGLLDSLERLCSVMRLRQYRKNRIRNLERQLMVERDFRQAAIREIIDLGVMLETLNIQKRNTEVLLEKQRLEMEEFQAQVEKHQTNMTTENKKLMEKVGALEDLLLTMSKEQQEQMETPEETCLEKKMMKKELKRKLEKLPIKLTKEQLEQTTLVVEKQFEKYKEKKISMTKEKKELLAQVLEKRLEAQREEEMMRKNRELEKIRLRKQAEQERYEEMMKKLRVIEERRLERLSRKSFFRKFLERFKKTEEFEIIN